MVASSNARIAGTIQSGPTLNRDGSSSGTTITRASAPSSGQGFSVPIPVRTTATLDTGLRRALSRLRAHQSRTMPSAGAAAGARPAASASAIRARAASIVADISFWFPSARTLTTIQARSGRAWICTGTPVAWASR
jgi:hypothetical protein